MLICAKSQNIGQKNMGHSSNLSQNSISKLERGMCQVDTQEKAEIAKSLGVLAYTEPAHKDPELYRG